MITKDVTLQAKVDDKQIKVRAVEEIKRRERQGSEGGEQMAALGFAPGLVFNFR